MSHLQIPVDEKPASVAVQRLAERLLQQQLMLGCAESCTGGWLAKLCTDLAGSSQWFERGFVTYSNDAKQQMLGVPASLLETFGAVSEQVAEAMAKGVLQNSKADVAVSITGIAGPGGGSEKKPVGTVCFAVAGNGVEVQLFREVFKGERNQVRLQAVMFALQRLVLLLDKKI